MQAPHPMPRYRGEALLTLREASILLALTAVILFAAEFCLNRLQLGATAQLIATGILSLSGILLPGIFLMSARSIAPRTVWGRDFSAGQAFWTLAMAILTLPAVWGLQLLWMIAMHNIGLSHLAQAQAIPNQPLLLQLLVVALGAAVTEEFLMRGIVLPALERRLGRNPALFLSALLFALLHGSVAQIPVTFVLGLILGLLTVSTGSLAAPIFYHAAHNALTLWIARLASSGEAATVSFAELLSEPGMKTAMLAAALFLIALGMLLGGLMYRSLAQRSLSAPVLFREASPLGFSTGMALTVMAGFLVLRILANALGVFG